MRDPQVVALSEEPAPTPAQEGPCLFCGEWIDPDTDGVYSLSLLEGNIEGRDYVCHVACLADRAHPTVRLP